MALLTWLKAKVQKPGSRGGRGYFDARGEWRYGERPIPDVRPAGGSLAVQLRSQKEIRFRGREVQGAADVAAAFRAMTDLDRERLWTVALDGQHQVLAIECVSIGGMDYALADTREIVKAPVALGASELFVIHNHPSGNPTPSMEDRFALDRVRGAGGQLGLAVRGLVVGRQGWSEVGRVGDDSTERTAPYHESGGRFGPPEVAAIRQTSFAVGSTIDHPDALLNAMRGLYSPDERTILAVGLDTRLRIVTANGLGTGLGAPSRAVVAPFLRSMLLNGARSVALVAGRNGEAWSGRDGTSGTVELWLLALGAAAKALRMPTVDFLVAGPRGYTSLRDNDAFRAVQVEQAPLMWKAMVYGRTPTVFTMLKGRLGAPKEPAGKIALGTTRSGAAVFASGAESGAFSDDDHQDAAQLHAAATVHHEHMATAHQEAAGRDDDWKRSEAHHQAADRHEALATHHTTLVRRHLVAGGHGGQVGLELKGGAATLRPMRRHPGAVRKAARDELAARSHHDHPGGVTEADKAAYAKFPSPQTADSAADGARPLGGATSG